MKVYLFFFIISFLFISCQSSNLSQSEEKKTDPRHTLIFLDKSASVHGDEEFRIQKYQEQVRLLVHEGIHQAGDKLDVYFLHENTQKGKTIQLVSKIVNDNTENLNPTDKESADLDFSFRQGKEKLLFEKKIMALVKEKNNSNSNQMTDISSTLEILSNQSTSAHSLTVYYFSDMLESTRTGRDFHKKKPEDQEMAKNWATEDAEKCKNVSLTHVSIVMVLPFSPTASSQINDPLVTLYWKTLFENLGALSVEEL